MYTIRIEKRCGPELSAMGYSVAKYADTFKTIAELIAYLNDIWNDNITYIEINSDKEIIDDNHCTIVVCSKDKRDSMFYINDLVSYINSLDISSVRKLFIRANQYRCGEATVLPPCSDEAKLDFESLYLIEKENLKIVTKIKDGLSNAYKELNKDYNQYRANQAHIWAKHLTANPLQEKQTKIELVSKGIKIAELERQVANFKRRFEEQRSINEKLREDAEKKTYPPGGYACSKNKEAPMNTKRPLYSLMKEIVIDGIKILITDIREENGQYSYKLELWPRPEYTQQHENIVIATLYKGIRLNWYTEKAVTDLLKIGEFPKPENIVSQNAPFRKSEEVKKEDNSKGKDGLIERDFLEKFKNLSPEDKASAQQFADSCGKKLEELTITHLLNGGPVKMTFSCSDIDLNNVTLYPEMDCSAVKKEEPDKPGPGEILSKYGKIVTSNAYSLDGLLIVIRRDSKDVAFNISDCNKAYPDYTRPEISLIDDEIIILNLIK